MVSSAGVALVRSTGTPLTAPAAEAFASTPATAPPSTAAPPAPGTPVVVPAAAPPFFWFLSVEGLPVPVAPPHGPAPRRSQAAGIGATSARWLRLRSPFTKVGLLQEVTERLV